MPDPANTQAFNRYSYVLNNPLKFTDPTGHCNEAGDDGDDPGECILNKGLLYERGISIENYAGGVWSLSELKLIYSGVSRLEAAAGWSSSDFHAHIGDVTIRQSLEWTGNANNPNISAITQPDFIFGNSPTITFYQSAFYESQANKQQGATRSNIDHLVIHELAHAWDFNTGMSGTIGIVIVGGTNPDGYRTRYAAGSPWYSQATEDWADSVAEYATGGSQVDQARLNYVRIAMTTWVGEKWNP